MIYFSQLFKTKVKDSSDVVVGRLRDILIQPAAGAYAPLMFLLVMNRRGEEKYLPYATVANLSSDVITLDRLLVNVPQAKPEGDYIFLDKDLLDEQIVDVEGARVVRVNDLKLGFFNGKMSLLAIDVSFKGILRRLGLGWLVGDLFSTKLIDWRKAQRVKGALQVDTISKDLIKLHPADLANIIEDLSTKHGARLVTSLDAETAAQVLEELDPRLQKVLVNRLGPDTAAQIVGKMSIDEVTDLIQMLPVKEAKRMLSHLPDVKQDSVEHLLAYEDDTAGGLMTTDFVKAYPEWTVERTMEEINKQSHSMRSVLYVYVVNQENIFKGAVSLRRLLLAKGKQTLAELVPTTHPLSALRVGHTIKDIVRIMTKYDLYTAAVLDKQDRLLGMVTIDDVMRCLHPEA